MSKLDFTLNKYKELCLAAEKSGYNILTVSGYLSNPGNTQPALIIRHDVDRLMGKALRMAVLEKSLGIKTTYYFRKAGFNKPEIIKSILAMGHEIGYHYESLDEAKGDHELALTLFKQGLEQLRKIVTVETICMHGNPLTKWINRNLWEKQDYHEFGIKGEAFLSIKDVFYFSDTGRIWDMSRKVKDMLPSTLPAQASNTIKIQTTNDLIGFIQRRGYPQIYICAHPERWSHNVYTWIIDQTKDMAMNMVKSILRKPLNSKL